MRQEKQKQKKKRRLKKEVLWILHGAFFVAVGIIMASRSFAAPVKSEYVVAYGETLPDADVFFTREASEASYATKEEIEAYLARTGEKETPQADTRVLGAHRVYLSYEGSIYTATLLVEDTEPPVIEGVTEQTVLVGENISYKRGISVSDNHDTLVTLRVDSSAVDLYTPGNYIVVFRASDMAGNETSANMMLHVVDPMVQQSEIPTEEPLTEEERILYAHADEILASIITEGMTPLEQARAIYNWVHDIEYIHMVEKQTDYENALQGLTARRGDCHVYEAAARVLLRRIGAETLTVTNIEPAVAHAWNLINLGEGWRHFDATRRYEEADLFYLTTRELMDYSSTHDYTHLFDESLYPATD
ncbi:MAG: transglutaminase domain-containing protein [Lachnospiraceae bacterium]|nr:transglutaminase domain-containing protein [Lachnospiraceae bacterium]